MSELGRNADVVMSLPGSGEVAVIKATSQECSRWWLLMADATVPVEWRISWRGRTRPTAAEVRVTGRSVRVSLEVVALEVWARSLGGVGVADVAVVPTEFQRDTSSEYEVVLADNGVVPVPAFAREVRLDVPTLDNPAGAKVELLNSEDAVICAIAPGSWAHLGSATSCRTTGVGTAHRLVFSLNL